MDQGYGPPGPAFCIPLDASWCTQGHRFPMPAATPLASPWVENKRQLLHGEPFLESERNFWKETFGNLGKKILNGCPMMMRQQVRHVLEPQHWVMLISIWVWLPKALLYSSLSHPNFSDQFLPAPPLLHPFLLTQKQVMMLFELSISFCMLPGTGGGWEKQTKDMSTNLQNTYLHQLSENEAFN